MSAPSEEPKSQEEIIRRYQAMTAECAKLVEKVTELEVDRNEHRLVAETLDPLDPNRRAFRLVGGVLVQLAVPAAAPHRHADAEDAARSALGPADGRKRVGDDDLPARTEERRRPLVQTSLRLL